MTVWVVVYCGPDRAAGTLQAAYSSRRSARLWFGRLLQTYPDHSWRHVRPETWRDGAGRQVYIQELEVEP